MTSLALLLGLEYKMDSKAKIFDDDQKQVLVIKIHFEVNIGEKAYWISLVLLSKL